VGFALRLLTVVLSDVSRQDACSISQAAPRNRGACSTWLPDASQRPASGSSIRCRSALQQRCKACIETALANCGFGQAGLSVVGTFAAQLPAGVTSACRGAGKAAGAGGARGQCGGGHASAGDRRCSTRRAVGRRRRSAARLAAGRQPAAGPGAAPCVRHHGAQRRRGTCLHFCPQAMLLEMRIHTWKGSQNSALYARKLNSGVAL
jgi:hypothetical protein